MRKLYLIALLAAAGMVYGCGYGDGTDVDNGGSTDKTGPLPQLATSCKTNMECKIGTNIVGDCVAGVCRRFCSDTDDCEKNTICEGGICQPVVDCLPLTFEDESNNSRYANKKCVKVFSVTPSVSWSQLLSGDLVFSKDNPKLFGEDTDFTSKDFSFELPHSVITEGVNFSMVTYLAINYLKLMITASSAIAQCTRPQVEEGNGWKDPVSYSAKYEYNISNTEITPSTMIAICDDATYRMDEDMDLYYEYVTTKGVCRLCKSNETTGCLKENEDDNRNKQEQLKCVIKEYQTMLKKKPACKVAVNALTVVRGFSKIMMQVSMSAVSSSSGYEGAEALSRWLNGIDAGTQFVYQTDFNKNSESYGASQLDLDCVESDTSEQLACTLGVFPIKYCDEDFWKQNVDKNALLARSLSEKDYQNSKSRIRYCSEADAAKLSSGSGRNKVSIYGQVYEFDPDLANRIADNNNSNDGTNMTMLKKSAMKSQLGSCVYMMKGAYDFSLMRALSKSDNIQLGKCGSHEKLRNATVNEYIQTPEYKKLFDMLDNVKSALTTLTDVDIASMSPLLSVELLYSKAADPSYIWLSGDSLFPLAINNSTGDFKEHELILDIVYRPTDAIFETTENSTTPLSESIHFVSYQDDDIRTNNDAVLNADPTKQRFEVKDDRHEPVSTFLYSNLNKNSDSHATVLYHKNTDCPNGKCTFYWRGHKASNSSAGMICGGITLVMKHADGYVVLDGDKIGTREVSSSNNR